MTILRVSFAALATDIGLVVQAVSCVPKREAEEDTMAPLGAPPSLSSRRARGSEEAQSRWEF